MARYTVEGVRFTESGLTVYGTVKWARTGIIRFAQVHVPWSFFDDSDAWALYSRNAKRRAEMDDGADEPSLPLDWS